MKLKSICLLLGALVFSSANAHFSESVVFNSTSPDGSQTDYYSIKIDGSGLRLLGAINCGQGFYFSQQYRALSVDPVTSKLYFLDQTGQVHVSRVNSPTSSTALPSFSMSTLSASNGILSGQVRGRNGIAILDTSTLTTTYVEASPSGSPWGGAILTANNSVLASSQFPGNINYTTTPYSINLSTLDVTRINSNVIAPNFWCYDPIGHWAYGTCEKGYSHSSPATLLFRMHPDGSDSSTWSGNQKYVGFSAVNSAGTLLAYVSGNDAGNFELVLSKTNGKNPRVLYTWPSGYYPHIGGFVRHIHRH